MDNNYYKLCKKIAKHIILAQCASDGGKGISLIKDMLGDESLYSYECGYGDKDHQIFSAMSLIARYHCKEFRYSVTRTDTCYARGSWCFLVYFTFKLNGKRYQVSFHSFNSGLYHYYKHSQNVYWDEKSSRRSCVLLANHYNMIASDWDISTWL